VERTRDGRSFTTRRVVAIQHGRPIFHMEVSFHIDEPGLTHQAEMPSAPDPESLPDWQERVGPIEEMESDDPHRWLSREPFDVRFITEIDPVKPQKLPPRLDLWIRLNGSLQQDLGLHQSLAAFASDLSLIDTIVLPHAVDIFEGAHQVASLDHAMWFHRPFRIDEWLLYSQESPVAAGARGFATGRIFTRDGQLVASVVQEGLVRPVTPS
jgi:acyl-CoA thioesterase-2